HAPGGFVEAARVLARTEQRHRPVVEPVGLQSFEDFLRIMQHRGRWIEADRLARAERRVVPAFAFGPVDRDHVVGKQRAESGVGNRLLTACTRNRGRVRNAGKIEGGGVDHLLNPCLGSSRAKFKYYNHASIFVILGTRRNQVVRSPSGGVGKGKRPAPPTAFAVSAPAAPAAAGGRQPARRPAPEQCPRRARRARAASRASTRTRTTGR